MSAQLSYDAAPAVAQKGMLAEQFSLRQVDSFLAEADVLFGYPLIYGTASSQAKYAETPSDKFVGISLLEKNVEQDSSGVAQYKDQDAMSVLRYGRVWVSCGVDPVAPGDSVYAGVGPELGKFFADDGLGTRLDCKGKFLTAGAGEELVLVELTWS